MTATAEKTDTQKDSDSNGRVVRVTGPVVDVEFPRGSVPELFNALHAEVTFEVARKNLDVGGGESSRRQHGAHDLDAAHGWAGPRRQR